MMSQILHVTGANRQGVWAISEYCRFAFVAVFQGLQDGGGSGPENQVFDAIKKYPCSDGYTTSATLL